MNKITSLIVIVAVCLIALLFILSPAGYKPPDPVLTEETIESWKLFDDPSVNYQASFPTVPKTASNNALDPKTRQLRIYKLYAAEALNGTLFLITEIQFPGDYNPNLDPTLLETIVSELVANGPTNSLKNMTQLQYNGMEALKFTIENDTNMVIMGLAFIHEQSVFILSRASTADKVNQNEFEYFVKSFKFKTPSTEVK